MKKTLLLLIFSPFFAFSQNKSDKPTIIDEGTVIKAALKNEIRGGSLKVGDEIAFELKDPIIGTNNYVAVSPGARIAGTVTEARASGVLGKKGKLAFSIDYLYLPSGQVIKLRGAQSKNLQGNGVAVAATAVLLTPLGLLIPGKGAKFEAGTVFSAYVDKQVEIRQ